MGVRSAGGARRAALLAAALGASACQVVRPTSPRSVTAGSTTIGLDHLRDDSVAVSVRGAPVRAGWLVEGPPARAACAAGVGADLVGTEMHGQSPPSGTSLVELRFPTGALFDHLTRPSSLALQLDDSSCAVLPLADHDPTLAYQIGWGGSIWNAGMMLSASAPLTGQSGIGWGVLDWDVFRIGRWLGPVRPTGAVGFTITSRLDSLHVAALLVGYPLVFRNVAVGVGAGYEARPSWGAVDAFEGLKLLHGPRVELLFMAVHAPLLGFPPPVKMRKVGVALWASRLDADRFGATIVGFGIVRE